ncbi:hypothetical protein [Treponema sp. C6A8]|uniref:hypothetical protein n=1 Tax=Treponema sp. C6A8 TaxID=1410609 RepID=UPI0004841BA5|nr:hypothetical protein [Treponema sp. C6A8]
MLYLETFLYYTFFASAVLFYGIGISRVGEFGIAKIPNAIFFVKNVSSIYITAILSWIITSKILLPLKITEIFPLVIFLILVGISAFFECLVRLTTNKLSTEFIISYSIVFLAIAESSSWINTLVICTGVICSIGVLCPFIITLRQRLMNNGQKMNEKFYSLFFIFLGVILLIFSVFDISWLNPGALR